MATKPQVQGKDDAQSTGTSHPACYRDPAGYDVSASRRRVCANGGASGEPGYITWDNAVVEAFWGHLQVEVLNRQRWNTRLELASAIFEWIEGFYNRRRRHSALDWASPIEFENNY